MKKTSIDLATVRLLHQTGHLHEAKTGYLELLKKNPKDITALHYLAILCVQQENISEGIEYLKTAIRYAPNDPTLQLHLANMLKTQGLYQQSIQVLEKLIAQHPDYVPALNNLGSVYYALGKLTDAIIFFRAALKKQEDYIDAQYNLGLALTKQNDFAAAIEIFTALLQQAPHYTPARFQLGCVYMLQEKMDAARQVFLSIESEHPHHFETLSNLATCYLKLGELNEAKKYYLQALELMPQDTQILFNLGVMHMQQGHVDSAIQQYQHALHIKPNFFAAHNNLAVAFLAKQHIQFALQHFREALNLQPNNEAIQHTIKMLSQDQRLSASSPAYIKNLFDSYADHYEPHLLNTLNYQVPELLKHALLNTKEIAPHSLDILDLGCGTGLCGIVLKEYAKTLTGIDLSEKMLEVAAKKNIYDQLIMDDLNHFLETQPASYDLIVAGDVLVYIGDLHAIFSDTHQALRNNGLWVFNTEISEQDNYVINQSGRFAHTKNYLTQLAQQFHFTFLFYETVVTRTQNNEPVYGHVCVLEKK